MKILVILIILLVTTNVYPSDCTVKKMQYLSETSTLILSGEVEEVEASLEIASGYFAVVQRVNYKVVKVIKGNFSEARVNVAHYVVSNSLTSEEDSKGTRLSKKIFFKGNKVILFLLPDPEKGYLEIPTKKTYSKFLSPDENCVLTDNEKVIKQIETYLLDYKEKAK